MKTPYTSIFWIFGVIVLLMVGAGLLIYFAYSPQVPSEAGAGQASAGQVGASFVQGLEPEVVMAIVIVLAIVIMMALLFAIAAGFANLKLANPAYALGLPDGSIRAMIALILIMVFIIFGVYLFRSVGAGEWEGPMRLGTYDEVLRLAEVANIRRVEDKSNAIQGRNYDVWIRSPLTDDGAQLAQQLVTTVGTLVVAVAGFYFGSSTFRSGVDVSREPTDRLGPVILSFTPQEGRQHDLVELKVVGRNLRRCQSISLVRGGDRLTNDRDVVSSDTEATAQIRLTASPGGDKWDLVVENENGAQDILPRIFTLNPEESGQSSATSAP